MTHTFSSLIALRPRELDAVLAAGATPRFSDLIGFEFRGWNVFGDPLAATVGTVMGIQRFAKGFFHRGAGAPDDAPYIEGYNVKIERGGSDEPWANKGGGAPIRHSFFRVLRAGEGDERRGRNQQALLLDYSKGDPRPGFFDGSGLRDFVVHPDPDIRDLLLGKAYMHIGPLANVAGYFVAERLRHHDFQGPVR
ncbi:MAG: hypothetical protein FJ137_06775 [Deltaproteobacteria bacterium]|nr:hypothetical protein [Deltaproteobacteria bacterium]